VIYGAGHAGESKAEMAELAALPNVRAALLPPASLRFMRSLPRRLRTCCGRFLAAAEIG